MPTPASYTFRVYQGATWAETIALKNADGTPFDLTGLSARMQLRGDYTDVAPSLELTTANSRLAIPVGTDGEITLLVSAVDTIALVQNHDITTYLYDLEVFREIPSPEYVVRALYGSVVVSPEITRA